MSDVDEAFGFDQGRGEVLDQDAVIDQRLTDSFLVWVAQHLGTVENLRNQGRVVWCPTWWEHPEVVSRLRALWGAHVAALTDENPRDRSSWWVDHWDRHASVLFDDLAGPFRQCTPSEHLGKRLGPTDEDHLAYVAPPATWRI